VDRGGCVNVLTSHRWTPFAFGTAQHTMMVEIEKKEERGRKNRKPSFPLPLSPDAK